METERELKRYLLYLISHNSPINGFRLTAAHPSRCLCFLLTYIAIQINDVVFPIWLFQRTSASVDPHIIYPFRWIIPFHFNDMAEPA